MDTGWHMDKTKKENCMEKDHLIQRMTQNAIAAGTIVQKISSVSKAVQYAVDLNKKKNIKNLVCEGLDAKDRDTLSDLCNAQNLDLLKSPLRQNAETIYTSLTFADYGIADTGTLMVKSDSEQIRLATMLAQIHIAILPMSKIKKDTTDIEADLDLILKNDSPSYTAFITGPSRTADIERVLAIGVHGPVELHLLLIKESRL
jgi:L-lactate dehydrogenase complex protein LldG